ncbi:hypothetical protein ColLi_04971 [Colletotrichum liriopes]|uniref:Uncharacterized protein n=1 Tax=Colletotrichum liriopes TaxID=708192 RepID=A0AA37GKZ3_9PEZI|nr:hypothetical protein ColLi_04971 [Colletotrichum liriopes]
MAGICDEGCCEMLKLEAGERDHLANSWGRVANRLAADHFESFSESPHSSRILLIEVLKDHESLEIIAGTLDRLKKI